ncbi:MAG: hypothetical protein QOE03_2589 [Micromonosporaceae bacterium]|nr:hypothetical protein [Micromonosporaceae bacterium]
MTVAQIATFALSVLISAAFVLGMVIVVGRALRHARNAARARLAAPGRRALLALAAGDDAPDNLDALVQLDPAVWRAVEPTAVALLGKVRGEAHAALVLAFEQRGMGDRALPELRARGAIRRARAAEVLGNLGRADAVPGLVYLLHDTDRDVRTVAARALGRIGDPAATRALLESLAGRHPVPPQTVADAVMRMGADAQPALAAALDHSADLVRATAVEVLGLIGAITVAPRVITALSDDQSPEVRQRAAAALGRLGTRSALAPLLEAVEPGRPPALRATAARALGDLGAVATAPALGALLSDPEHTVAHAAAYSLLRLGNAGRQVLEHAAGPGPAAGPDPTHTAGSAGDRAAGYAREALARFDLDDQRRTGEVGATVAPPPSPVTDGSGPVIGSAPTAVGGR